VHAVADQGRVRRAVLVEGPAGCRHTEVDDAAGLADSRLLFSLVRHC
jgi:hypothetical protein